MSKIFLSGFYGMRNTGDDALLAVSAWGAQTYLDADSCRVTAGELPRLPGLAQLSPIFRPAPAAHDHDRGVRMERRLRSFGAALGTRRVLFGGGSVFHTHGDLRDKLIVTRCSGGSGHLALGVGVGPFRDTRAERTCAELFKRFAFIGTRDAESLEIARTLAPDTPSAQTFDLAPLLGEALNVAPDTARGTRRGIGIALCKDEHASDRDARVVDSIARAIGRDAGAIDEIVLIDFNGHERLGDHPLHRALAERIASSVPIRHLPYDPNPAAVLKTIGRLRGMVAMRLHAAVFAYLARTPTVLLSYHPKCMGWARDARLPAAVVLDRPDPAPEALYAALEAALTGGGKPGLALPSAIAAARQNWLLAARAVTGVGTVRQAVRAAL
ncbi:polysaccharide pyruvyl transferase family protein [Xanthobacter sp. KR7-65]|uniref:polysaccharide pyruvyl transferase family protein n=1 Tax=Xanthobacter sp. KR7-65 TaxID=3156612 RepID=UPI0032B32DFD